MTSSCKDCKYMVQRPEKNPFSTDEIIIRECRRNSPTVINAGEEGIYRRGWPHVDEIDWCGRWERKEV